MRYFGEFAKFWFCRNLGMINYGICGNAECGIEFADFFLINFFRIKFCKFNFAEKQFALVNFPKKFSFQTNFALFAEIFFLILHTLIQYSS